MYFLQYQIAEGYLLIGWITGWKETRKPIQVPEDSPQEAIRAQAETMWALVRSMYPKGWVQNASIWKFEGSL